MLYAHLPEKIKRCVERRWFNERRRRVFYEKTAELYNNGIRIDQILESLENRSARKNGAKSVEAGVYRKIRSRFSQSGSFADALSLYTPIIERILIRAGEQSGHLSDNLRTAGDLGEKNARMKSVAARSLAYPMLILALSVAVLCWFSASLFPALEDFVPISDWPLLSRALYSFGQFLAEWAVFGILGAVSLAFLFVWSLPRMTGPARIRLDRFPPWSFYRLSQGAAWISSLSSMVSAGTTTNNALSIIGEEAKGNRWLYERTIAVKNKLASSRSLGEALDTKYRFPDAELCEDMLDYAASANFDRVFDRIGREWADSGVARMEAEARILNGAAMCLSMLVIVGLLQSIMGLMMDVSAVISGV